MSSNCCFIDSVTYKAQDKRHGNLIWQSHSTCWDFDCGQLSPRPYPNLQLSNHNNHYDDIVSLSYFLTLILKRKKLTMNIFFSMKTKTSL